MIVSVSPAQKEDLVGLIDKTEFKDVYGSRRMMKWHVQLSSDIWVGKADDEIACAFGVIPPSLVSTQAYLWIITTDVVKRHKFIFIRYSQRVLDVLLTKYEILTGFCLCSQPSAIKWVKMLGATFADPENDMLKFVIRRK